MVMKTGPIGKTGPYYRTDEFYDQTYDSLIEPYWGGNGAKKLPQLPRQPTPQAAAWLLEGIYPPLGLEVKRHRHRNQGNAGLQSWDKSIGVALAAFWSPAEQKKLMNCLRQALDEGHKEVFPYLQCRMGPQGRVKIPANPIAANHFHIYNFNGDPAPHAHTIYFSTSPCEDGKLRAIHNWREALYKKQRVVNAVVQLKTAELLRREFGFRMELKNGNAAVAEVPRDLCRAFSSRTKEMEAYLRKHKVNGHMARSIAAKVTRRERSRLPRAERWAEWQQVIRLYDFDVKKIMRKDHRHGTLGDAMALIAEATKNLLNKRAVFSTDDLLVETAKLGISAGVSLRHIKDAVSVVVDRPELYGLGRREEMFSKSSWRPQVFSAQTWKKSKGIFNLTQAVVRLLQRKKTVIKVRADLPRSRKQSLKRLLEDVKPPSRRSAHWAAFKAVRRRRWNSIQKMLKYAEEQYKAARKPRRQLTKRHVLVVEKIEFASAKELGELSRLEKRMRVVVTTGLAPDLGPEVKQGPVR